MNALHSKPPIAAGITNKIAMGFVGFGVLLRIIQYAYNRGFWYDEAMLALNLTNRSFIGLTQPLDLHQGAPIGFLFIQKSIMLLLGNKDYILRLFPLVMGIAALTLMYRVAFDYLPDFGALIAVGLFAFSPRLIYYTSEMKQYSCDVFIALFLLFLAYRCLDSEAKPGDFITLGISGALLLWFSHPALFLLAGTGIVLALDMVLKKTKNWVLWLGMVSLIWTGSLGILYLVSLRSLTANTTLINFWRVGFMPFPPWQEPTWILNAFLTMIENPVGIIQPSIKILTLILFLMGSLSFLLRKWQTALLVILPFPLTLAASGMEKYPFYERMILFLVPLVFLLVCEGIEGICRLSKRTKVNSWVTLFGGVILAGILLFTPTIQSIRNIWQPNLKEHIKPALAYLEQHKESTDFIYVYYGTGPSFTYYAPFYGIQPEDYVTGIMSRDEPEKYIEQLDSLISNSNGRVWFIFSHNCSWCMVNEESYITKHLGDLGKRIDIFSAPGASLYLYDFGVLK